MLHFFWEGIRGGGKAFLPNKTKKTVQTCNPMALSWHFFYIFFWLWWGNLQVFVEHKNPRFLFLRDIFPRKGHPTKGPNSDCFCKKFRGDKLINPKLWVLKKISDIIRIP